MEEPILGQIELFAFGYNPMYWLPCNGQLLNINQNQALYALIGTTYGGDGQATFALPNLNNSPADLRPMPSETPFMQYYIAVQGYFPQRN